MGILSSRLGMEPLRIRTVVQKRFWFQVQHNSNIVELTFETVELSISKEHLMVKKQRPQSQNWTKKKKKTFVFYKLRCFFFLFPRTWYPKVFHPIRLDLTRANAHQVKCGGVEYKTWGTSPRIMPLPNKVIVKEIQGWQD